jgi:hypothetical protein
MKTQTEFLVQYRNVYAQPNTTQVSFASSNASGVTFTNDPAAIFKNATNVQFTMTYRAA